MSSNPVPLKVHCLTMTNISYNKQNSSNIYGLTCNRDKKTKKLKTKKAIILKKHKKRA